MDQVFDVAIIGGGINGCGCAADAALRGLSVVLFEQGDIASQTSSSSTKLIHGGLRYLEHYEFKLVKKALDERQRLLELAPHLVFPISFVLPYQKHLRPAWLLRLGLFVYDHLSRKNLLPSCRSIKRKQSPNLFAPLKNEFHKGLFFYDAATDDSRLCLANALQAKEHGASIRTHATVIQVENKDQLWQLTIQPKKGPHYTVKAKTLINTAGPWVESVAKMAGVAVHQEMTLVKGSHIVVPQIYEGDQAFFLQNKDKRIVFVIPYHGMSMVGTTDVDYSGPLDNMQISNDETLYLIQIVNSYFTKQLDPKDLIYSWSGVRTLLSAKGKDAKTLSRDYSYQFDMQPVPVITVYGGKITTYRQLSEEVINQLKTVFPNLGPSLTAKTPLPGAAFGAMNFAQYVVYAEEKYKWLDADLLHRYLTTYGTHTEKFLSQCTDMTSLGIKFGAMLYQAEVDYLVAEEWAQNTDDILKRRTKLILQMDPVGQKTLVEYLNVHSTLGLGPTTYGMGLNIY